MIMNVLQLRSGGAEIFGSDLTLGEKVALKSQNFAVQVKACLATLATRRLATVVTSLSYI